MRPQRRIASAFALILLAACGENLASTPTTDEPSAESQPTADSTSPPSTIAPTAPAPTASQPSTPPTTQPPVPSIEPPVPSIDWANHSYPVDCLDSGATAITLVNGEQSPAPENLMVSASLLSTTDAGGGNTLIQITCAATAYIYGIQAILAGPDGTILSTVPLESAVSIDSTSFTTPIFEGWESGTHPDDAASVQLHSLVVDGTQLVVSDGATKPKCAQLGTQDWTSDVSEGVARNDQGALVKLFQQKLIDEGYGAEVVSTGGADGYYGFGTVGAATDYLFDKFDLFSGEMPDWFGEGEGGPVYIYWLDVGWTQTLGLDCYGEYRPTIPNY